MEAMSIPPQFKTVSDFRMQPFDPDRLLQFYDRMGFRDLKKRVRSQIDFGKRTTQAKPTTVPGRYDSILEGGKGGKSSGNMSTQLSPPQDPKPQRSSNFEKSMKYKPPPQPSDFDDVPF